MGRMDEEWYRNEARRRYAKPRSDVAKPAAEVRGYADVERAADGPTKPCVLAEPNPTVSNGTNPGAWVMLWVWVPDPPPEEPENGQEEDRADRGGPANGA